MASCVQKVNWLVIGRLLKPKEENTSKGSAAGSARLADALQKERYSIGICYSWSNMSNLVNVAPRT